MDENKKRWLESYLMLERMQTSIVRKIDAMRLDKTCPSVINDGMPHAHGGGDLSDYIARKEPYENRLLDLEAAKIEIGREIMRAAREVGKDWELVRLRYIEGKSRKDILKEKRMKKTEYHERLNRVTTMMVINGGLIDGLLQMVGCENCGKCM